VVAAGIGDPSVPEPIEALLHLVAGGRIDEAKAIAAIEDAEMVLFVDLDDDVWVDASLDVEEAVSRYLPTYALEIYAGEQFITCTPQSFDYLLRMTFEEAQPLGVPAASVGRICLAAARKMQSTPVACSFASTVAYWAETLGDREDAKRIWAPYEWMSDGEWTPSERNTLFLEPPIGGEASADADDFIAGVAAIVERGRRERQPDLLYFGLRNIALAYSGSGRLDEAHTAFNEAVLLAPEHISPVAMLVLLGDMLRVATAGDNATAVGTAVERFAGLTERTPPRVGAAAVFARTARLLYAVSEPQAAFRCVSRIAECLR
jgi:hypothetical protein